MITQLPCGHCGSDHTAPAKAPLHEGLEGVSETLSGRFGGFIFRHFKVVTKQTFGQIEALHRICEDCNGYTLVCCFCNDSIPVERFYSRGSSGGRCRRCDKLLYVEFN